MRLLQLATPSGDTLDLHPRVSVVRGLSPASRDALLSTVRGLTSPETVHAARGLLEAHGVIFDLDPAAIRALDLDGAGIDPVVSGGDLPAETQSVDLRELRAKEREFAAIVAQVAEKAEAETQARAAVDRASAALARARAERAEADSDLGSGLTRVEALTAKLERLEAERVAAERDVAEAAAALEAAERALAEVEERTAGERHPIEPALARLAELEAALEEARTQSDEDAPGAVEAALAREAALVEQLEALDRGRGGSSPGEAHGVEADTTASREERAAELERTLLALDVPDTTAVEQALAAVESRLGAPGQPSSEAAALADEIEAVVAEVADQDVVEIDTAAVDAARRRLDEARQALIAAEEAIRNPHLDPDKVAAIEAAHEELLRAVDKASSRLGGGRARARLDALRAAEHEALSALGFHSYTDYMMGNSTMSADTAAQANLQAARRELTAAEQAWAEMESLTEAALAQATIMDRRRALARRAGALLGTGGLPFAELPDALRQVRVLPDDVVAAGDDLRHALTDAGMEVVDLGLDVEDLADLARTWLAEASAVEQRRADVEQQIARLRDEPASPADDASAAEERAGDAVRQDLEAQLAAAREATTDARARLAAHGEAEAERQRLGDEVAVAEAQVEALRQAAGEAEQEHQRAADARDQSAAALEAAAAARDHAVEVIEATREKLADLDARAAGGTDGLAAAVEEAEVALLRASSELEAATADVTALNSEGQAIALEVERLQDIVAAGDGKEVSSASELEWYILARIAAQRSVSLAGSLPLVIDDAFAGLPAEDVVHVLERLEPMTDTVQVIVVSDDEAVASWAAEAGPSRAAVVAPTAA